MTEITPFDPSIASSTNSRDTTNLLPRIYRTDSNKKFFNSTLTQLTQPGTVKKIVAFIGRQYSKVTKNTDIFLTAPEENRQNYQLEPVAIIKDKHDNTTFYKDYIDHINHIDIFGGDISNHERVNRQESYSWEPHICWDKFVNYQDYYWQPQGPKAINVVGQQQDIQSTLVVTVNANGFQFGTDVLLTNPEIILYRGQTYTFNLSTGNEPFVIATSREISDSTYYNTGVSANSKSTGSITFQVGRNTPDVLYYTSQNNQNFGGVFKIFDIDENTFLDVTSDIIGKSEYIMSNGVPLANGMRLHFKGNVSPERYSNTFWYVEGVGTQIALIQDKELAISGTYFYQSDSQFDNEGFDSTPFATNSDYANTHEYIVINRNAPDRNPWAKVNRWFHKDVLSISESLNGGVASLDQSNRAIRPIIEFNDGLKLFNFGQYSKLDVDLIDTFTTDIFSTIEGSIGYYVDQVLLTEGMRVLFTKDTDPRANNKIYQVKFVKVNLPGRMISFNGNQIDTVYNTIQFSFNHGLTNGLPITFLTDGNPTIEGLINRQVYYPKVLSDNTIQIYTDPLMTDLVPLPADITGVYKFEVFVGLRRQITLIETEDTLPNEMDTVFVKSGSGNSGKTFWYNGTAWTEGQLKTSANQPPLFDVFDIYGNSFGDTSIYPQSSFIGTKLFSYKVGNGSNDVALGFPLSYRNINNIGDIAFSFDLIADSFTYVANDKVKEIATKTGYLLEYSKYVNGWVKTDTTFYQPVVRVFANSELTNGFPIDVYDTYTSINVKPYINGFYVKDFALDAKVIFNVSIAAIAGHTALVQFSHNEKVISETTYNLSKSGFKFNNIIITAPVSSVEDVANIQVKVLVDGIETASTFNYTLDTLSVVFNNDVATSDIVTLKCYSPEPKNHNGFYEIPINLQNNPLNEDVVDFTLGQVIDHVNTIVENAPNHSLNKGSVSKYGTKVVQHTGPLNLSLYHLGSKNANIIDALEHARDDYRLFKLSFLSAISNTGVHINDQKHVDMILTKMFKDKPKTASYYLSDMFAYTAYNTIEITVLDSRTTIYPLSAHFDLATLTNKSVLVYLNGEQLLHGLDYTFGDSDFIYITTSLSEGDIIRIQEYDSTDASFCPPTPTKLGLYPKFEPKIYLDTTLVTPVNVIQGHDGSIIKAFDDYRDGLILELEKRIFNNIKIEYDPSVFDIYDYINGYARPLDYTRDEITATLSGAFYFWKTNINQDFSQNIGYDILNPFTYNYSGSTAPDGTSVPAYWRGIYTWMLDTDRPHLCPWEILGFSIKPLWWDETYGEAPYTNGNLLLWDDISKGIIRGTADVNPKFARPFINIEDLGSIPVTEHGELVDPVSTNMIIGYTGITNQDTFIFGDYGPVETAWRRSSNYPFAVITSAILQNPSKVLGTCLDRSRIIKNLCDQYIYSDTGVRLKLADIKLPSSINDSTRIFAAGLINYVAEFVTNEVGYNLASYKSDLVSLTNVIGSKLGGFTSKPKFNILLDSKTPSSSGGVFIPEENYDISLNTSSVIRKVEYSGIIITKLADGYEVSGYNINNPFFKYYSFGATAKIIRVGGISETYSEWLPNQYYIVGKIVRINNTYYRVNISHTTTNKIESEYYTKLPQLPIIGGVEAAIRKNWDYRSYNVMSYGTILSTIQDVADFIQGYAQYLLGQGFVFDYLSESDSSIRNWDSSLNEFLFWTTQHWTDQATLAISPAASRLKLSTGLSIVNDLFDPLFKYQIYQEDGKKLEGGYLTSFREANIFGMSPKNTTHGIYGATLYLIQKEHVLTIDNTTVFNDMVYDLPFGYKQDRVKIIGYMSENWYGGFNIPGFIYDTAVVTDWAQWTDYHIGDIVKHQEFYYAANDFTIGSASFIPEQWVRLDEKPTPKLIPNWEYRSNQFADFYDLDSDNFDPEQQRMAQHLIGYQKREYMANIINDDVSQYKFYQGMILEKGTGNVLHKLFDVLSADGLASVTFNEEWAVRVGHYGATETFTELECVLDESQFKLTPQPLQLSSDIVPNVINITPTIVPVNYNTLTNWAPLINDVPFLRSAGYARYSEVDFAIDNLDSLGNVFEYSAGQYIWCGFEERGWNIYKVTPLVTTGVPTTNITHDITIPFDNLPRILNEGDKIGVYTELLGEILIIKHASDTSVIVNSTIFTAGPPTHFYYFKSVRYATTIDVDANEPLVWVDNHNGNGWAIIKNNELIHYQTTSADNSQIKKAFVYDSSSIEYLDVIDIPNGKLPGIAEQELKYKTYYDPAIYTDSDGTNNVNIDEGLSWTTRNVGELWWDLTRAKFIVNQGNDILYRTSTWNQLYATASIDIYEWVESTYLPSEWDRNADTDLGYTLGMSGTTRYGDSAYSMTRKYDPVAQSYVNVYYYWVKNKSIIPNVKGRTLPASSVSSLLSNPLLYGYECMSLIGQNSFVLCNVKEGNLNIETWITDKRDNNIHSEWKLISDNTNTILPAKVEQKWIDSLIGIDYNNNQIPDYNIPTKLRYGIENRPLQSMFINRIEALKQYVTLVNTALGKQLIVDNYDMSGLFTLDKLPLMTSKTWDYMVDTYYDLKFIGTANVRTAILSPVIDNGKLISVSIIDAGYGYVNEPLVTISGDGFGATVSVTLSVTGSIESITVLDSGYGYLSNTTITVRDFSVLVVSDTTDKWTLYKWNKLQSTWAISNQQSYDTTKYWSYIDWYSEGYDQFTKIVDIVDNTDMLFINTYNVGDIVKVKHAGTGGWILVLKTGDVSNIEFTLNYDIIAKQNGTIQLSSSLYSYDSKIYPVTALQPDPYYIVVHKELRNILVSLKNDILIGDLRQYYLQLFFSSIRYAMYEQPLVDWVFKTSFINATHHVGLLDQPVNYRNDNLQNFEDYINEVKPYRTKVREYVSSYSNLDDTQTFISDFDLPNVIDNDKNYTSIYAVLDGSGNISSDQQFINSYPWKAWLDNVGFSVTDVTINNGGEGYAAAPTVNFIDGFGTGASAQAYITNGKVTRVRLISGGEGYLRAPTIEFSGGLTFRGVSATASAVIGNAVIRTNVLSMKYDRVTPYYEMKHLSTVETFVGQRNKLQFSLQWSAQSSTAKVMVNSIEVLKDDYYIINTTRKIAGYIRHYAILVFSVAPNVGDTITVEYDKDVVHMMATDRINYYYSPVVGQYGKDLSQLMIGVDYAGVIVTGAALKMSTGWDSVEWDSDAWDGFQVSYDNYSTVVEIGTNVIPLPYTPIVDERLNVYIDGIRVDGIRVDGTENYLPTVIGDGQLNSVFIPDVAYDVIANKESQVIDSYQDKNIKIVSQTVQLSGNTCEIDHLATAEFRTIKYKVQLILDTTYTFDMTLLYNDNDEVALSVPNFSDEYSIDYSATVINGSITLTVTSLNPLNSLDGMFIVMVKWMFSDGDKYEALQPWGLNDTNFMLSTEHFYTYDALEPEVLDEFSADQFNSGCYYVQLSDGITVQSCELEVLHNNGIVKLQMNDNIILGDPDGCATFSAIIDGDLIAVIITPTHENVNIVYSKLLLTGINLNNISNKSYRRIANGAFILTNFEHSLRNTDKVIIDTFDTLICTSARYQIQLLGHNTCQVVDMMASIDDGYDNQLVFQASLDTNGICGSFTHRIVDGIYELIFTPSIKNVYVNAIKTMIGNSYTSSLPVLNTDIMQYDVISVKVPTTHSAIIDRYDTNYRLAKYKIQINSIYGIENKELSILYTDGEANVTEYAVMGTVDNGTFTAIVSNNQVELIYDAMHPNTDIILFRTLLSDSDLGLPSITVLSDTNFYIDTKVVDITTGDTVLASYDVSKVNSVKYTMLITDGLNYQSVQLAMTTDTTVVKLTGYDINGPELIEFSAEINAGQLQLIGNTLVGSITVEWIEEVIAYNSQLDILPDSVPSIFNKTVRLDSIKYTTFDMSPAIVDVIDTTEYTNGYYKIQAISGPNVNILDLHFTTNGDHTQYAIIDIGLSCGTFSCNADSGFIDVIFTPALPNVTITIIRNLVDADLNNVVFANGLELFDDLGKKATISVIKESSDGSLAGQVFDYNTGISIDNYDSTIAGGDFINLSAIGFRPDDLSIEGDSFDTTTAPEELLPGYLLDTFAIKVYQTGNGSYMQFKDILNRDHYKRLNNNKITTLAVDLTQSDSTILVIDGSKLDNPSNGNPGVIEIHGERIEYFAKNGNTLSLLQRGTLGTGAPYIHRMGTEVLNISASETVQYNDDFIIDRFITKRKTNTIPLSYIPHKNSDNENGYFTGVIVQGVYILKFIPKIITPTIITDVVSINDTRLKSWKMNKVIIDEYDYSIESMKYEVHLNNPNGYSYCEVNIVYSNSELYYNITSMMSIGEELGVLSAEYVNGKIKLWFLPQYNNVDIVFRKVAMKSTVDAVADTVLSSQQHLLASYYTTLVQNTNTVLKTFDSSNANVAKYTILLSTGTLNYTSTVLLVTDGVYVNIVEYAINGTFIDCVYDAIISSGIVSLIVTNNSTYDIDITLIEEQWGSLSILPSSVSDIQNYNVTSDSASKNITGLSTTILDYFDSSIYTGGQYDIVLKHNTSVNILTLKFIQVNGNIIFAIENMTEINGVLGTIDCQYIGGRVNILFTSLVTGITATYSRTLFNANLLTAFDQYSYGYSNDIEVYVGGTRLNKNAYSLFTGDASSYSPEGDVQYDADFKVDGILSHVKLTKPVKKGTEIKVIKKQGMVWGDEIINRLEFAPSPMPPEIIDKYQYTLLTDSSETLTTDDGVILEMD